jgi:integrase
MTTILLTNQFIKTGLQCPEGKNRIEYCDTEGSAPGLYVEVRSTSEGRGTYYLRYKDTTGKTCHQKVGLTADLPLAEARKRARDLKAKIQLGADPRAQAKAQRAVPTLSEFFKDSYLPYAKQQKRSWTRDEVLFRLRVEPTFGHLRLNEIKRQPVQTFLGVIVDQGIAQATADHHVKLLRQMLNRAVEWEVIDINPVARIKLFNPDNRKENYLEGEELTKLLEVLRTDQNRGVCNAALFLLCTGARLNEALSATWDHIDRANKVWRIPATNSKSKRVRSVPLNDAAIDLLNGLGAEEERGTRLFFSEKTGEPLKYVHKVWERIRKSAGQPALRLHDLRHQYASFLVNDGRTLYEVQKILGHSSHAVTERYAHLSSTSLMAAANSASVMIKGAQPKVA